MNECVKSDSRRHGDEEFSGKSVPSVRVVTGGWDFVGLVAKETPATGQKAAAQRQADFFRRVVLNLHSWRELRDGTREGGKGLVGQDSQAAPVSGELSKRLHIHQADQPWKQNQKQLQSHWSVQQGWKIEYQDIK